MQLTEDVVKPLIDGGVETQSEFENLFLQPYACLFLSSIASQDVQDLGKIKLLEDVLSVLVVKTVKAVQSVTVVTTLFAGNIQKRKQL